MAEEVIREQCPVCMDTGAVKVLGEDSYNDSTDPHYHYSNKAIFLHCQQCRAYYLKVGHSNEHDEEIFQDETGEWERHYPYRFSYRPPMPHRRRPDWLGRLTSPEQVAFKSLLKDVNQAHDHQMNQLAMMGIRTLFEDISTSIGVEGHRLAQKLDELLELDLIDKHSYDALGILVEGGHAAVHRGWDPTIEDVTIVLEILEAFIYAVFFKDEDEERVQKRRAMVRARIPKKT